MTTIFNTQGWPKKHLDGGDYIKFANNELLVLHNCFLKPLKLAVFDCTDIDFLNEWHELASHANKT